MNTNKNMKAKMLVIFGWLIVLSVGALAQHNDSSALVEKNRRDHQALENSSKLSPASQDLHQRLIKSADNRATARILEDAVKTGDRSIVPYLKARREAGLDSPQSLDLALVALGETEIVDKVIEEANSDDPATRYWAVWKLARFKTKASYRKLYELLDDVKMRDPVPDDDAPINTMSWVTMDILSSTVANPPKDRSSTLAWKEWFEKNRHLQ